MQLPLEWGRGMGSAEVAYKAAGKFTVTAAFY